MERSVIRGCLRAVSICGLACDYARMSPNAVLRIEFFSFAITSILLGAWVVLSFNQWRNGDLTIVWGFLTVILAAALVFDVHRLSKRHSRNAGQSRKGMLARLIGIVLVCVATGMTFMLGVENWSRGDPVFWAQLVGALALLILAAVAGRKVLTTRSP
jgi:hypothetical protein